MKTVHVFGSLLDMISFLSGNCFAAIANISQAGHQLYETGKEDIEQVAVKAHFFEAVKRSVEEVLRVSEEIALDATNASAIHGLELLSRAHSNGAGGYIMSVHDAERLSWILTQIKMNFSAQLDSRVVFVLNSTNADFLLTDEPPFGREVDDAFPRAAEEIAEAAKCLALQRNTACVFHLMRAMERAVARLSETIGTGHSTEKEWGKILSDIHQKIEAMPKGEERNRWSESHSHLYHVKQAWRNDTMHPKKTYTDDQAQAVFDAVRSFMRHLASLVD